MLSGLQPEVSCRLAALEDGVAGRGQLLDFELAAPPRDFGMFVRNELIPGHGPGAGSPAQHETLIRGECVLQSITGSKSFRDQFGHFSHLPLYSAE